MEKVHTQEIWENSPIQNIHIPPRRLLGGEALDASEDKERSLLDWLKDILVLLPKCDKALSLFIERKRTDFPRFCFMSSVNLLDILSNGNDPASINKFLK